MLASCSTDVSRDATEGFLSELSMTLVSAMSQESSMILDDFNESSPPGPELPEIPILSDYLPMPGTELGVEKLRALREPYGIDSLYGTWRYNVLTDEWYLYDPGNPANAILFEWAYLDTASVAHAAEILIDSLEFYQDSLPENIWIGIKIDDEPTWLAWIKLEATYVSLEQVSMVSLIYEIVGYFQVGATISSPTAIDSNFVGEVHLWVIDRTNRNYRVDLTVTVNDSTSATYVELVLEDSHDWRMEVDISEVVETDGEFERRDVSGEITRSGTHAAYIDGEIWDPEDETHRTVITITYSDGSVGPFLGYQ
jgi:hypothetical protein